MKRPPKANDLHSNKNKKSVQPFLLWKISRANRNSMIKRTLEDIALVMLCSFILFILTLPPLKHLEWRQWIAAIILMYKYCACLELQKRAAQPQLPQQTLLQILTELLFTPSLGKQLVLLEWGGSTLLFFSSPDVAPSCYFYSARSTT